MRMKNLAIFAMLIGLVFSAAGCSPVEAKRERGTANGDVIEADALLDVKTTRSVRSQVVDYTGHRLSFNPELHIPNWVAWELTGEEVAGTNPRKDNFQPDSRVDGCAGLGDYRGSGYDRGHMVPSGDLKWSAQAMDEACLLTNICPQLHSLNGGAWKSLEEKCRTWATADSAIYIVCGPIITDKPIEYIGETGVFVPARFYKCIIAPYAVPPRGIAFIMPNGQVPGGMQSAAVSIDEVERITGYDFFSALPDALEDAIEAQCDFNCWGHRK